MKCTICGKLIEYVPSLTERKKAHPSSTSKWDYTPLAQEHPQCALDKARRETSELINRRYS
jgi:rubredoxin